MELSFYRLTAGAARADERLSALSVRERDALAATAQRTASRLGLRRGSEDIPLVLSPVSLPRAELDGLARTAQLIVSALVKVARAILDGAAERRRLLFAHLAPLEEAALALRSREAEELLISRVDWLVDKTGRARALEVNATIPAMPAYSDAAIAGWLEAVCPGAATALAARNPRNAVWLVEALLETARAAGRGGDAEAFPRGLEVQLLHRDGDPQLPELEALAAILRARGAKARTVTPAQVVLDGGRGGIIYRHLFARYVDPASPLGRAFLDPERHGIWNRVNGWLETKGLFAELSAYASTNGASLSSEEAAAVASHLPRTRLLDEVSDAALGTGESVVLKKSHDYGGKSVVIGAEAGKGRFGAALATARKDPPGSWVVQELIDAPTLSRWVCVPPSQGGIAARRAELHLDISTYVSLLPGVPLGGSVCRAAPGRVVNIAGGGGVAPLFADEVLLEALEAA